MTGSPLGIPVTHLFDSERDGAKLAGLGGVTDAGARLLERVTPSPSPLAGGFLRELVQSYEREHPGVKLLIRDGGRRSIFAPSAPAN